MNIYDQIVAVCKGYEGEILTSSQIKDMVSDKFGTNRNSVLPPDYCYNRINKGIDFNKHIFVMINHNEYKYLGRNYSYSGLILSRAKGTSQDIIVGEWENGQYHLYAAQPKTATNKIKDTSVTYSGMGQEQIQRLYEEYMEILELEINVFGCKPTETRHLIGRVGEFKCALLINGTLSHVVNQNGFDVIDSAKRKVSVKSSAQKTGFVSINKNTVHKADDLMILQYDKGELKIIYHGDIRAAIKVARTYKDRYELDLSKARKLMKDLQNTERGAALDRRETTHASQ